MDQAFAMRVFIKVVEEGSFSKAAPHVGITQSSASRYISALEDELGVQLIQRSTRKLNLSEAGQIYYESARQIIDDIDMARLAVKQLNTTPSGLLRVTAPAAFGLRHIAPLLGAFHLQHPAVRIGLSLSDGIEDIIGSGFDLAIRFGALSDSNMVANRLAVSHSLVCASAAYLDKAGTPKIPADLENHNCLTFRTTPGQNTWQFEAQGKSHSISVSGSLYSGNADALLKAAISGLGIVQLPIWMLGEEIKNGNLVPILSAFELTPRTAPIHAVFVHKQYLAAKIRVFMEFLKESYKDQNW